MKKEIEEAIEKVQENESEVVSQWLNRHWVNFEIIIPHTWWAIYKLTVNNKTHILEKKNEFNTEWNATTCISIYIEKTL